MIFNNKISGDLLLPELEKIGGNFLLKRVSLKDEKLTTIQQALFIGLNNFETIRMPKLQCMSNIISKYDQKFKILHCSCKVYH